MSAVLTTITPYWGRPEMLQIWCAALKGSSNIGVQHLVIFVGDSPPPWFEELEPFGIRSLHCAEKPGASIGHYHNLGIRAASTEWVMKLDVDCLPHIRFFDELLPILHKTQDREWFNVGMFYSSSACASLLLRLCDMPLSTSAFLMICARADLRSSKQTFPAGSNFVCKREDYLKMGGCDERFQGYGWEDYHQLYLLEHRRRGHDPLPGVLSIGNVTLRCREEISRSLAASLFQRNHWLALIHRWHPSKGGEYRSHLRRNREILFEAIMKKRNSK